MRRFAGTRIGAAFFSRVLRPVDAVAWRLSGGHWTVSSIGAGLPVIRLVTSGARSGLPRAAPLVGVPVEGGLLVIGSNFGQPAMPGWAVNLGRDPRASVQYHGSHRPVHAQLLTGEAAADALAHAAKLYPPFLVYAERQRKRGVPVYLLRDSPQPAAP